MSSSAKALVTPLRPPAAPAAAPPPAEHPDVAAAAESLVAPLDDFPRIDLRAQGEPWERRRAVGAGLRRAAPHAVHAGWSPAADRPDPVAVLEATNRGRQESLVPLRMARMAEGPFAFLRGAAAVMAGDLARVPASGIQVLIDGDAHADNFGLFGTPEGEVVLDLNDFDEVMVGPWEWDLKRLVASIAVAGRENGLDRRDRRRAVEGAVAGYRASMAWLAPQGGLDMWRHASRADSLRFKGLEMDAASRAVLERAVAKARRKTNATLLREVGERRVDGGWRFRPDPPVLTCVDARTRGRVITALEHYAETLPRERRFMLQRYHVVDVVHRVVGVGSVGTRAYLALLFGNSDTDAIFLQVKEAFPPAHAPHGPPLPEPYASHGGHRVVYGQRLLQAVGDPLLGWTELDGRPFYVRQMKNMKGSIPLAGLTGRPFGFYAASFGALLARAHARTGDAAAIAGYCGEAPTLDAALADWAEAYADQTERDHAALVEAIASGRVIAAAEEALPDPGTLRGAPHPSAHAGRTG